VVGRAEERSDPGRDDQDDEGKDAAAGDAEPVRGGEDLAIVAGRPQDEKAIKRQVGRELGDAHQYGEGGGNTELGRRQEAGEDDRAAEAGGELDQRRHRCERSEREEPAQIHYPARLALVAGGNRRRSGLVSMSGRAGEAKRPNGSGVAPCLTKNNLITLP